MQYTQTIKTGSVISGRDFREMFAAATDWLGKSVPEINSLNVFPVPDGDTGTNMHLTMQSCVEAASQLEDMSVSSVVNAMSRGALLGARGNSGVILSQIWRGLQQGLTGKDHINCADLANAFQQAAVSAREGISNPVEGTIITVMREVAHACQRGMKKGKHSVTGILQIAVDAAAEAVSNTPFQLPVLMEAGVVDAGGQGLYTLLEGALLSLKKNRSHLRSGKTTIISMQAGQSGPYPVLSADNEEPYGYCTGFLIKGQNLDPDTIRENLKDKGESLIVVGDENAVRIHIHAVDPSEVLHYAVTRGTVHDISIRNMDEQVADRLAEQKSKEIVLREGVAVIAISLGDGLCALFSKLGAAAVVPGGQTMNPSTRDILDAVEAVPFTEIIILPNNKNVILAAQKTISLAEKKFIVLPTTSLPQNRSHGDLCAVRFELL
jgi:DAK2 domain fusion protein YloV